MTNSTHTRRRILVGAAGTVLGLSLAGCTSQGGDPAQADSPTPTSEHDDGEQHDDEEDHGDGDDHGETEGHDETETGSHDDGDDEHGHNHDEGTPEGPAHEAHVTLRTEDGEQHFDPHLAWIEPGGTVTWENESGQHDAAAYHPDNDKPRRIPEGADSWHTDLLTEAGDTGSHTFETEGVYDYYCSPHESVGMVGTVIVGEPDAHDQPALETPQDSLPEGARHELEDLATQANEALGHTH